MCTPFHSRGNAYTSGLGNESVVSDKVQEERQVWVIRDSSNLSARSFIPGAMTFESSSPQLNTNHVRASEALLPPTRHPDPSIIKPKGYRPSNPALSRPLAQCTSTWVDAQTQGRASPRYQRTTNLKLPGDMNEASVLQKKGLAVSVHETAPENVAHSPESVQYRWPSNFDRGSNSAGPRSLDLVHSLPNIGQTRCLPSTYQIPPEILATPDSPDSLLPRSNFGASQIDESIWDWDSALNPGVLDTSGRSKIYTDAVNPINSIDDNLDWNPTYPMSLTTQVSNEGTINSNTSYSPAEAFNQDFWAEFDHAHSEHLDWPGNFSTWYSPSSVDKGCGPIDPRTEEQFLSPNYTWSPISSFSSKEFTPEAGLPPSDFKPSVFKDEKGPRGIPQIETHEEDTSPWPQRGRTENMGQPRAATTSSHTKQYDARGRQKRPAVKGMQRSESKDDFLVRSKLSGMSYKEIKVKGGFDEAESTLRGRFRTLTKRKEHRVRKPEWYERDVSDLSQIQIW